MWSVAFHESCHPRPRPASRGNDAQVSTGNAAVAARHPPAVGAAKESGSFAAVRPRVWDFLLTWYPIDMAHTERQVVVGDRGRLVLPSAVRAALGITRGTRMLLSTETDGSLRLRPYRVVAEESRGLLAGLTPAGASLVDELLAERRAEAALENDD